MKQEVAGKEQDLQWQALNAVLELFRGHSAIEDFQAIFDMTWTDAMEQGGLRMNDVGKALRHPHAHRR